MADNGASFADLVRSFTTFLTVAIHTILYERHIYPATSFLSARKYNYAVRQNRHPRVCEWVTDAVAEVEAELLKCSVDRVAVVIYGPNEQPLERFMFDVSRLPVVPTQEISTPMRRLDDRDGESAVLPAEDLEEQFRAAMSRLSGCGARLKDIPDGCTFTVALELKDESEPPLKEPQAWIPVEPGLQKTVNRSSDGIKAVKGEHVGGARTIPVRTVAAGEMMFEMWIEEGKTKFQASVDDANDSEPE